MTLHLTSCRTTDYPLSEIRQLADMIDRGDLLHTGSFECDNCGDDIFPPDGITPRQQEIIVAALRAFA